jgi:GTP-binding protein
LSRRVDAAEPVQPPAKADPLVIRSLDYLGPMAEDGGWRPAPDLPEVAFAGRSNVGKSSLINALVRRKKAARVSHTPGRTRELHFFAVNRTFTLVDLPGYGYARISKARRADWVPLIEGYLRTSAPLAGLVHLLDARREPTADDGRMLDLLLDLRVPTLFVATKVDKLGTQERAERLPALAAAVGVAEEDLIPFSTVTGEGRDVLAEAVVQLISAPPIWRTPE